MADKKTKAAVTVKTLDQLRTDLAAKRTELLEARRGHAAGELANPHVLTTIRKDIARLMTAIQAAPATEKESN